MTTIPITIEDEERQHTDRLQCLAADALTMLVHATGFEGDGDETVPSGHGLVSQLVVTAGELGVEFGPTISDNRKRFRQL